MAGETPQMKLAREQAEKTGVVGDHEWPRDAFGTPLVKVQASASELVATRQYSNVTIGPISVTRFVADQGDEGLMMEIRKTQSLCERAVAEERQTVHEMIRQSTNDSR